MRYTVEYQVATYSGTVTVHADDEEQAIARAKAQLSRNAPLPLGYQRFTATADE